MKTSFLRTIHFFFDLYPKRTIVVVGLLILSGLAEAIGVASFLPLLQIVLENKGDTLPQGFVSDVLAAIGLTAKFSVIAGLIIAAMAAKAALLWIAMRYVSGTVTNVAADLRMRLMRGLLHANWGYFVTHTLGSSLNAVATETLQASTAFLSATRFIAACIQFTIYAIGAFIVSWVVFTGGIVIGSLIIFMLWGLVRVARRAGIAQTEIAKQLLVQMADMLQGIKPLRAMALEDKFLSVMKKQSRGLQTAQAEQLTSSQSMRIFNEPLMMIAGVCGLYLAVSYGNLESSALILMGILFMRILTSMNTAQGEYQRLAAQEASLWSLMGAIDEAENSYQKWPGSALMPQNADNISFRNVSFHHKEGGVLLQNISLDFPARKLTALIGISGSGKTSILDLICGFYVPTQGAILVGDTPIHEIELNQWRKAIGFVPQEVFLFNDTVFENIAIGRNCKEADVWAALKAAGGEDFVKSMPNGVHSSVGENGRMLSGGQRQRIAIARAIIGNPRFLLLDEATSALDPATETHLLETLKNLSRSITVIFISHNRGILNHADLVYELSHGQVRERIAA